MAVSFAQTLVQYSVLSVTEAKSVTVEKELNADVVQMTVSAARVMNGTVTLPSTVGESAVQTAPVIAAALLASETVALRLVVTVVGLL